MENIKEISQEADEKKLKSILNNLLASQFEMVLFLLDKTSKISYGTPQAKKTEELIELLKKEESSLDNLKSVIKKTFPHIKI